MIRACLMRWSGYGPREFLKSNFEIEYGTKFYESFYKEIYRHRKQAIFSCCCFYCFWIFLGWCTSLELLGEIYTGDTREVHGNGKFYIIIEHVSSFFLHFGGGIWTEKQTILIAKTTWILYLWCASQKKYCITLAKADRTNSKRHLQQRPLTHLFLDWHIR